MQMQQAVFTTPHPAPLATRTNQMTFGQPPLGVYPYENLGATGWGSQEHCFQKSSLWLSPNLSSKSSSVWLALFLYHVGHPNKHHQQIRLTTQISKSPLVLIRLFCIFTGTYQGPKKLPMLETSATVTGQP